MNVIGIERKVMQNLVVMHHLITRHIEDGYSKRSTGERFMYELNKVRFRRHCSLLIRCSLNSPSTTLSKYRFNILSIMFLDFTLWGLNRMKGIVGTYSFIPDFAVTRYRE